MRAYAGVSRIRLVRVVTDGGGKVKAALNVIDVARFLVGATRKRPGAWWREEFTVRLRPSMACPVSSWTDPRERCRLRRSRLRATLFERCTWCAIRISCGTWRRHQCRTRAIEDEPAGRRGPRRLGAHHYRCNEVGTLEVGTLQEAQPSKLNQAGRRVMSHWAVRNSAPDRLTSAAN